MRLQRRHWRRQLHRAVAYTADEQPVEIGSYLQTDLVGSGIDMVRVVSIEHWRSKHYAVCVLDSTFEQRYCTVPLQVE